jgi:pyridoxine/pyridoxamine 5'-phosphate oxidase
MDRWTGRETQSEAGAWMTRKKRREEKRRALKGKKEESSEEFSETEDPTGERGLYFPSRPRTLT